MESQLAAFLFVEGTLYHARTKITAVIAARMSDTRSSRFIAGSAVWEMFPSLVIR
jgi:hypothetical protein